MSLDTDVLIIGAGMSGIGLAIQFPKKYPYASFEIIEKSDRLGGTWWANTYPGCGCDVPSHLYSYSFALNPDWSRMYALQPELIAYFRSVAGAYAITRHIKYRSTVKSASFDERTGTWTITILDQRTKQLRQRRAKILVSAVGALSIPNECGIKGVEKFRGNLFHSAKWDHTFNWEGKDVVVVGNGCSGTQFVPLMTDSKGGVRRLTQFSRQPHWVFERPNPYYSTLFKLSMRYIPLVMRLYRFWHFYLMESNFFGFFIDSGREIRADSVKTQLEYMKRTAPAKYHEVLTPKTEIGCKRKVLDSDYYACLHRENMELVASDPIDEITEDGIRTQSGREVYADAIVLANGFQTQQGLYPLVIKGKKGVTLNEHWSNCSGGSAQAYYGTCVSGFPNFFIMMGPNTATGHLSVIFSTECQINFTLHSIRPILNSLYPSRLPYLSPFGGTSPDVVAVRSDAEQSENEWIQSAVKNFIWMSGCSNWYTDVRTGKNTMLYPDWQWKYWLRSIFIPFKSDFTFSSSPVRVFGKNYGENRSYQTAVTMITLGLGLAVGAGFVRLQGGFDLNRIRDISVKAGQELFRTLKS